MSKHHSRGFTVIELMIAVAIVAILGAVALPAYQGYVVRSKVPSGLESLSSVATRMEQYYQDNGNYGTAGCGNGLPMPTPSNYQQVSCVITNGGQGFTATATGTSGGPLAGYAYTINHRGARTTANHPKGANATCWSIKGSVCDT